jgi:hypothetical protein
MPSVSEAGTKQPRPSRRRPGDMLMTPATAPRARSRVVETNTPEEFFARPQYERTRQFLSQILH